MKKFVFLEHTADIKFQAFGKTQEQCFENSASAILDILVKKPIKNVQIKKIFISGEDKESLLYNFLEEILFLIDSENFLIAEIKNLQIKNNSLSADLMGDSSKNYTFETNIKAITYNDMFVKKEEDLWTAQVVVDV